MEVKLEQKQSGMQNAAEPAGLSSSLLPPRCLVKVAVIF